MGVFIKAAERGVGVGVAVGVGVGVRVSVAVGVGVAEGNTVTEGEGDGYGVMVAPVQPASSNIRLSPSISFCDISVSPWIK